MIDNRKQGEKGEKMKYRWDAVGRGILRLPSSSVRKKPGMRVRVALEPETCKEGLLQV